MVLLIPIRLGCLRIIVSDAYIEGVASVVGLAARCRVVIVDLVKPFSTALIASIVQWSRRVLRLLRGKLRLLSVGCLVPLN